MLILKNKFAPWQIPFIVNILKCKESGFKKNGICESTLSAPQTAEEILQLFYLL